MSEKKQSTLFKSGFSQTIDHRETNANTGRVHLHYTDKEDDMLSYEPPKKTDAWQTVDGGFRRLLKALSKT